MRVACATAASNFVPEQVPAALIPLQVEGGGEGDELGAKTRQLWSLGKDNGSILVWRKEGETDEAEWALAAILDGHETNVVFAAQVQGENGSRSVVTGSLDGTLCCWHCGILTCARKVRIPSRYGTIRGGTFDRESGFLAVLTRRDAPDTDFVLLVSPLHFGLESVLCNTSAYPICGIHSGEAGAKVSYQLGEDGMLLANLETLQKFDPAKSKHVHVESQAAGLRNLVGSVLGSDQHQRTGPTHVSLSPDETLLFFVHRGRRRLVTYRASNKSERDAVYDQSVDLGEEHSQDHCTGGVMWTKQGDDGVYLFSHFQSNKATLQRIGRANRLRKSGNLGVVVTSQVEIECDLNWEGKSTPWVALDGSVLARSFRNESRLCLELTRVTCEATEGRVRFTPRSYYYGGKACGSHEQRQESTVVVEGVLRNCLGHTFVHALGYDNGNIALMPWPAVEEGQDTNCDNQQRSLVGHTSPVSCFAEWQVPGTKGDAIKVLLSGCESGEIKMWDLASLECISSISVSRSGISDFILQERKHSIPWSECFGVVGKDGTMSFVSAKQMQVVRAFLAYPTKHELVSIAWDCKRNYVACLCMPPPQDGNTRTFLCTIIDVLSSQVERTAWGSRALSAFADFVAMDQAQISLCNYRRTCKTLKYSYSLVQKSLKMSVISSDLDLLLEASASQPELQLILCTVMRAMHVHHIDEGVNLAFQRVMNAAIGGINQKKDCKASETPTHVLHTFPTLVGPENSYTIWLCANRARTGAPPPAELMAHMNLVVLAGLGWAHSKSFLSPEEFSALNTFYGIRVPEAIASQSPLDIMFSYVEYIEHTNEHARDASSVLLNSTIAHTWDKAGALGRMQVTLRRHKRGSRAWAKCLLVLGSIALSFEGDYDHHVVVSEIVSSVGYVDIPFHSSLVSLLTRGIAAAAAEWQGIVEQCFGKLVTSIVNAIHAVNGQGSPHTSPRKDGKSPFTTLLARDKLMQLLTLLMQKNIRKFMNIFTEKLCSGEVNSESSIVPMVFTSILSLINAHPWSLFGATHQVVSACFTCMDPSNSTMRKSYLHIGMTIICEMGQKLPFIDLNAQTMLICIPASPVEKNASRYIHVFNAKSGDLVHELQFENQKHLTPLAVRISPDSESLACFSVEDACIRIWSIKQSWTATFRMSPRVQLPAKCIQCNLSLQGKDKSAKHMQGYELKWKSPSELFLMHDGKQLGRISL